jgi:hypothetical protein
VNNPVDSMVDPNPEDDHNDLSYDRKQSSNGLITSSKPVMLPSNSLRLHLDDPSAPLTTPHDPAHPPSDASSKHLRHSRVRFRSRVRITSGFGHHRRKSDVGSSRSGSPSSSISAPLRSYPDDTNAWGTLGQRVGLLALQKKIIGTHKTQRQRKELIFPSQNADERTPLRNSFNNSPYIEGEGVQDGDVFDDDMDDERQSHEVDNVFGKFPGRLLNRHVSSLAFLPLDTLLIVLFISGGTGSFNQLYAVIMSPISNSL